MKYLLLVAFCVAVNSEGIVRTITVGASEDLAKILEETMPKKCTKNGKEYAIEEEFEIGHLRYKCQKYGVYTIEGCSSTEGKRMNVGDKEVEDNIASQCFKRGNSVFFRSTVCGILGMPDCDKITPKTRSATNKKNINKSFSKTEESSKNAKQMNNRKMKITTKITQLTMLKQDTPIQNTTGETESHSQQTRTIITSQPAMQTKELPAAPGLPEGWKIVDEHGQTVPIAGVKLISRTLAFQPNRK